MIKTSLMRYVCDDCIYVDNCSFKVDIRAFDDILPIWVPGPFGICHRIKDAEECNVFEKFCHFIGASVDELRAL